MPKLDDPAPLPPREPDAADCCGEGCVNCIFDLYEAALLRYKADLAAWQGRQCDAGPALSGAPARTADAATQKP